MERRFDRIFTARVRVKNVKGRPVYEITIAKEVADSLNLERGDYVEVGVRRLGK